MPKKHEAPKIVEVPKIIELKRPGDAPAGRWYIFATAPVEKIISEYRKQSRRDPPQKIYHYRSALGNWEYYLIVEEDK